MAQRRMFSLQITDSDAFLDMPQSSQLLYFHLAMRADDDGFVGNPKKIIRMIGAGEDDIKVLLSKRFILSFQSGVVVIKHWKIHNYIQKDRYTETKYLEEKKGLVVKENGAYTECIQNVSSMDTQVRLGKVSIGKDTLAETSSAEEFSLKKEVQKLEDSERRDLQIIGWYLSERKDLDIRNKDQFQRILKRHLPSAKLLISFDDDQLVVGFKKAKIQTPEWVLETVLKMLSK